MEIATVIADDFEPSLGCEVVLVQEGGGRIVARLMRCDRSGSAPPPGVTRAPFSLIMEAQADVVPAGNWAHFTLMLPAEQTIGPIYVERIAGPDPRIAYFQAVFS